MLTVIFDMDGVIFDSENVCIRCWREYGQEHGLRDVDAMFRECIGTTTEGTREVVMRYEGETFDFDSFRNETSERFRMIEDSEGLPIKQGARELLEYLKDIGAHVGLASSTRSNIVKRQLSHAGLIDYFDLIIGGEMAKKSKPEPDIYLEACRCMGIKPSEAYGVEDSFNGVRALYAAEMHPIMVPDILAPDDEMYEKTEFICSSLFEVRDLFKRILEQP